MEKTVIGKSKLWIARDSDGDICLYSEVPEKGPTNKYWDSEGDTIILLNDTPSEEAILDCPGIDNTPVETRLLPVQQLERILVKAARDILTGKYLTEDEFLEYLRKNDYGLDG